MNRTYLFTALEKRVSSMEADLRALVDKSPLAKELKKLRDLGIDLQPCLVHVVAVKVQEVPEGELGPSLSTTPQTRAALKKYLPEFGDREFTTSDAINLLEQKGFTYVVGSVVSALLSHNKIPGMSFSKRYSKTKKRGGTYLIFKRIA